MINEKFTYSKELRIIETQDYQKDDVHEIINEINRKTFEFEEYLNKHYVQDDLFEQYTPETTKNILSERLITEMYEGWGAWFIPDDSPNGGRLVQVKDHSDYASKHFNNDWDSFEQAINAGWIRIAYPLHDGDAWAFNGVGKENMGKAIRALKSKIIGGKPRTIYIDYGNDNGEWEQNNTKNFDFQYKWGLTNEGISEGINDGVNQYWSKDDNVHQDIKDRMNVGKHPKPEQEAEINNSKQLMGYDPYGTPVYTVNGELVRQYAYSDFSLGGNDQAYPNFIPKNEIWVDQDIEGGNRETTIAHESTERHEMFAQHKFYDVGSGKNEHGAHGDALGKEHKIRAGKAEPLKLTKQQLQEMVTEVKDRQIKRLTIFDLDGCLLDTPLPDFGKPQWENKTGKEYPHKGWWSKTESLDTGVFDIKAFPSVLNQFKDEEKRHDTMVIAMTNRLSKLRPQMINVLNKNGINPSALNMMENDGQGKGSRILSILKENPNIDYVAFYDDQEENIANVRQALDTVGIKYDLYNCQDGKIRRT